MSGEGIIPSRPKPSGEVVLRKRLPRSTFVCPVCGSEGGIRRHEKVTPLVSTLWVHCLNTDCGMTWRSAIEFVHVISPSAIVRPDIDLPQAPADFPRQTYAQGPPGAMPADPDQMTMFESGGDQQGDEGEREAA